MTNESSRRKFLTGAGFFAAGVATGTLNSWGPELIARLQEWAGDFNPERGGVQFREGTEAQLEKMKTYFHVEPDGMVAIYDIQTDKMKTYPVDLTRYMPGIMAAWIPEKRRWLLLCSEGGTEEISIRLPTEFFQSTRPGRKRRRYNRPFV